MTTTFETSLHSGMPTRGTHILLTTIQGPSAVPEDTCRPNGSQNISFPDTRRSRIRGIVSYKMQNEVREKIFLRRKCE
jgi:hypothetical protein